MLAGKFHAALLLCILAFLEVSRAEDIWVDEDASNEFLEVRGESYGLGEHLSRIKRGIWDFWLSSSTTTEKPGNSEELSERDDETSDDKEDETDTDGSGLPDLSLAEPKEKTLRVTFVVMEPYQPEYSNRDSNQFQTFSKSLAEEVNKVFEKIPGTQRASLVRIQSRASDEFSCKVTLDIVTTGYEDTDKITKILRDHINTTRILGTVAVSDSDFSATVIDPGTIANFDECSPDEMQCNDGHCVHNSAKCNGISDCSDSSDEVNCPSPDHNWGQRGDIPFTTESDRYNEVSTNASNSETITAAAVTTEQVSCADPIFCIASAVTICPSQRCDGVRDCPGGEDEQDCEKPNSGCLNDELICDETRCVPLIKKCDGVPDCYDGKDEFGCEDESCGEDDFRCNNGKCIEGNKRCDRIVDCPNEEDEQNCECNADEFRCVSDGSCIENRKRCDGINHCNDKSDELDCDANNCALGAFTCNPGSSILCAKRCDGLQECSNGEDEDGCEECNHQCDGRCLEDSRICDQIPDCSDGSDELHCDTCDGPDDFRCKSGECINAAQRCNDIPECPDYSDELNCNETMIPSSQGCTENQFQCRDGSCIDSQFYCDGHQDCNDNSDEENCRCDDESWQCLSGQCIPTSAYCDGATDCPDGSDEVNCATTRPYFPAPYLTTPTQRTYYTTTPTSYRPYIPTANQGSVVLNLKTYPDEQSVRYAKYQSGGDVVFQCRDEGPQRAPVRWVREGGRPLKPGSLDRNGRLEINQVSVSDSGVYICQAPRYLGSPGSELRVTLTVESKPITQRPPFIVCQSYEATCGNGQCIPKSAVCDGKYDCSDRSDEEACNQNGVCEPNQFECANRRCVLKTWLCDSEDDCSDGSDEQNCGGPEPGQACLPVEFACASDSQCVPKSFHCDGQSDCMDGSDEIGCAPVHVTKPPQPSNIKLNPGDTLTLVCEAVGVPTPLITWRLNWGHVPQKCTSRSVEGSGTLTCPNMQFEDSGAYSCEAINNRGTTFAAPDSIVIVNRTDVCPSGYFNSEARSQSECIRCFCFGESTQCRSADLFTYNMPTPLGEGGTRLVGIKQAYTGEIQMDSQPVQDQYYYESLRNGATVTKLANYGPRPSVVHPYLTLPETYNGNQLTSYGGHIKYRVSPHSQRFRYDNKLPDIIIKGKYETLVHYHRRDNPRESYIEARLTPENWQKAGPRGLVQATREDIMMALDNVNMILLRGDMNDAGVNITDFTMESAQHINVGLGAASLVEECTCPPGYEGLSCQKCASGYGREKSGPWLGNCVHEEKPCPPGTYGDPGSGYGCRPCPCPLTNRENQFARTCSLASDGGVTCDCAPGYEGRNCERCAPGYLGNPMVPGDSCRLRPAANCDPVGTLRIRIPDQCDCRDNVQGTYCNQCKNESFFLSADFRQGCALCFCSGVSQQCTSTNLRRKTTSVAFNIPQIVDQVKVYNSASFGPAGAVRYNTPVEAPLQPQLVRGELTLSGFEQSQPTIYYWGLPRSFSGDKVTSYGGYLRYELRHMPYPGSQSSKNSAADVQLISDNHLTFHYFGNFAPTNDGYLNASVQLLETGWQRSDGKEVSREHFLLALADVKTFLVKATYTTGTELSSLLSASIETAEVGGDGPQALHVEQCVCPVGYVGTSCEDCAPGYTRSSSGLYLEHCSPCDCNGHSNMCHPETGVCFDCADNTGGNNCEICKPGYEKDAYQNCVPAYQPTPGFQCNCDPRGTASPCDVSGQCYCKQNVEGQNCDRCRPGTFGLETSNPLGCLQCYCSGATNDCHEASHYTRIPIPAPIFGENYGGYSLMDLNAERVINDQFVPATNESELMYIFSFRPEGELYWSLPVFPGNRVLSYGGVLALTQKFQSGGYTEQSQPGTDVVLVGDENSLFWTNPTLLRSGESLTYQVPLKEDGWSILNTATPASRQDMMSTLKNLRRVLVRATLSPNIVSTAIADVSMDTATESFSPGAPVATSVEICMCPPGYSGSSCELCASEYYKDRYGMCRPCRCNGNDCQLNAYGEVTCNCRPPYTGPDCSQLEGEPSTEITTRPPPPQTTLIVRITSPTIRIQEVGSSVNFTCEAQSRLTQGRLPVTWNKANGYLPQERSQIDSRTGSLVITNVQVSDSGKYICQSSDGVSTAQAIATLKVPGNEMSIPTVTIRPAINEYREGDRIQIECLTSGNPAPRITWQRSSGRPLPFSAQHYESYFIIDSARVEDSGEYRCIATNAAGSTDRTAIITVRPKSPRPVPDQLSVSPTSSNVLEGQSTRVVCTGTANVPAGSIGWMRQDGAQLSPNVRSDNGVLYIDIARLENQGIYMCQTSAPGIAPIPVLVSVKPLGTPPPSEMSNITVSVDHLKIPTGGSGTVDCDPQGYPLPFISWKKYDGNFGPGTSQRENTLIISDAKEEDQGYYLCEGNVDGSPVANIYVFVEIEKREPPRVETWPQGEQAVPLGGQFELHCRVLGGAPEPDVVWGRSGGRPLSRYVQIQPHNVLKFEHIEVNDEGEYTCTATNLAGSASASAVLKVRSPPEITITPSNFIEARLDEPVTVECRANGYPEPLLSIKTSPEYRELVAPAPGIAVLRIPAVTERDDGDYICTASSPAGTIEEQFGIRVSRGDGGFGVPEGSGEDFSYNPSDMRPSNLVAIEGQESRIGCNASSDFEVRWGRADRRPLQWNAVQVGSELIIRNTSKSDAGQYECILINRRTGDVQQTAATSLLVMAPPKITLRPPTQTVRPGQSPTVECVVEGDDILEVSWRPVTRPLSIRVEPRHSTLIFHQIEVEDAGQYECFATNRIANATAVAEVIVSGAKEDTPSLVTIDQPRRRFRVGENVEVLCRSRSRDIRLNWERLGTNQFVESRTYGDGSLLVLPGVEESDTGVYRCTGVDPYGRSTSDDFTLEIEPGSRGPEYPDPDKEVIYTARVNDYVDLPCTHNLESPVNIEWRKEYTPLAPEIRANEPVLRLEKVTEADAGTYICRISNSRAAVETRATLRVAGVVPRFDGNSWISLPSLRDAYSQFDIEISFKPTDANGLILYNSQNQGRTGDYLALQLLDGIPQFVLETSSGPVVLLGDRPLQLNTWHTIRLNRSNSKVTMDVDNTGPFIKESSGQWDILDLNQNLYIGGVPDYDQLPGQLAGASGFIGCISMLILGREEKNLMVDALSKYNVKECDTCSPNLCQNNGVCQEARNEHGYMCLCAAGFAGLNCDRTGEACRPGLCGRGKCTDTADGYKCSCPVTHTGRNCDIQQSIEYPAFTGSAYLAIKPPQPARTLRLSMKVKATSPVSDGIIMYCAESAKGHGGFTSLAVRDGKVEFRYDLGDGSGPIILTSTKPLQPNEWTDIHIARIGPVVSLKINIIDSVEGKLISPKNDLYLETPMFVGGVDDSIILNNNTGVSGGFSGCIKDVMVYGSQVDIVNSSIQSANVQECSNYDRGDIPEAESVCSQCRNGGYCTSGDATSCTCQPGYTGVYCEIAPPQSSYRAPRDNPCSARPCRNRGICREDPSTRLNYTCDCPLGFAGVNCQMPLELLQSVGFNGNGYLELPAELLRYDSIDREPVVVALAMHTANDGVLLYQREALSPPNSGDYVLLRVDRGYVTIEWDLGGGYSTLINEDVFVADGERHEIIAKLFNDHRVSLTVDGYTRTGDTTGFTNLMNADSNVYIGGMPDALNVQNHPGLTGCIEQVELMGSTRGINLGQVAVAARNTQRCRESRPAY